METQERQRAQVREVHGECVVAEGKRGCRGEGKAGLHLLLLVSEMSWFRHVTMGWGISDARCPLALPVLPLGQKIPRKGSQGFWAGES